MNNPEEHPASSVYHLQKAGTVTIHQLKTWPEYFCQVIDAAKNFEFRINDRDFKKGDLLMLREWDPSTESYTGRSCRRSVVYVLHEFPGMLPGYVVMALSHLVFIDAKPEPGATNEVQEAVAHVLRLMRHAVNTEMSGSLNRLGRGQWLGMMAERRRNNETADTLAGYYGLCLGPWPETTGEF
ncbi:ASCH/PUA domain-containing protein [Hymenobacter sp. YC55]|uniref:ASCH/PUA domain-containing protein n=1 Tax=Hymenobacter sp. YC55 TaxID=3034019 RepID=UPI0023F896E4|nr:ASCH/PUA domain-containing protein [Hymenobacter sp. YC55]MDF7810725.1 DUF3850 domain-containing protein [Hymenobacter sp. YC55]